VLSAADKLVVVSFAPPLAAVDSRPVVVARAIEETWPDERMVWELRRRRGKKYEYDPVEHDEDRDAWLCGEAGDGRIPFVTNAVDDRLITLSGLTEAASLGSGGVAQLYVFGELPGTPPFLERAPAMLARLVSGLDAHWGMVTPEAAHLEIASQVIPAGSGDTPPRGLPPLLRSFDELDGPNLPHRLGWVNYWSSATAARLRFPDERRDQEWLGRAQQTAGGWIVRITDEPLDLERAEHLDALQRAYARFGAIGRQRR
jgi:hypothetical protein